MHSCFHELHSTFNIAYHFSPRYILKKIQESSKSIKSFIYLSSKIKSKEPFWRFSKITWSITNIQIISCCLLHQNDRPTPSFFSANMNLPFAWRTSCHLDLKQDWNAISSRGKKKKKLIEGIIITRIHIWDSYLHEFYGILSSLSLNSCSLLYIPRKFSLSIRQMRLQLPKNFWLPDSVIAVIACKSLYLYRH